MLKKSSSVSLGNKIFSWEAPEYHRHDRGTLWYILFCLVMFGSAVFFLYWDPEWGWVSAMTFCLVAAIYFWIHKDDGKYHQIDIYDRGLEVDERFQFSWNRFRGYWILEDHYSRLVIFEPEKKPADRVILQLEDVSETQLREALSMVEMKEIPKKEQQEGLTDLWIRALKL